MLDMRVGVAIQEGGHDARVLVDVQKVDPVVTLNQEFAVKDAYAAN